MCLIIQRPANIALDFEQFKTAVSNNPDGYGLSAADGDGQLITLRDHIKPDPEKLFRMIDEEFRDVPILVHLRYTTAGKTNLRNAHPFPILEYETDGVDLRMAHNGTLTSYKGNTDESDTRRFVRQFVRPLFKRLRRAYDVEDILKDDWVHWLLDNEITGSSVLSFIDGNGNTLNVNAKGNGGFFTDDGVYYSNKYSFDPSHRDDWSNWGYYDNNKNVYSGQQSSFKGKSSNAVALTPPSSQNHAKDTQVQKFSELYQLLDVDDMTEVGDEFIEFLVKDHPDDAVLFIKEALYEWSKLLNKVSN